MSSKRIRVVIAEDSDAMRTTLETLLGADHRLEIIGSARDGFEAVSMTKTLRPDVVTMDVVMPHIDGVEATARIMADSPVRILVISSYVDDRQVDLSFRAIAAGALEVLAKPMTSRPDELRAWARRVCDAIVLMAEVPVITRRHRKAPHAQHGRVDAIGMVASTGGPLALSQIFATLPEDLPVPLFVAQHIAEGFTAGLVRWLSSASRIRVVVTVDGIAPRPGHAYFAPDRHDLEIGSDGRLHTPKAIDRYAPSGDRMLASLAGHYGRHAAGLVLTGMGADGAAGLLAIRDAGGVTLAQSQQSCTVFGMPQAAVARGATSDLHSLESLTAQIVVLSGWRVAR